MKTLIQTLMCVSVAAMCVRPALADDWFQRATNKAKEAGNLADKARKAIDDAMGKKDDATPKDGGIGEVLAGAAAQAGPAASLQFEGSAATTAYLIGVVDGSGGFQSGDSRVLIEQTHVHDDGTVAFLGAVGEGAHALSKVNRGSRSLCSWDTNGLRVQTIDALGGDSSMLGFSKLFLHGYFVVSDNASWALRKSHGVAVKELFRRGDAMPGYPGEVMRQCSLLGATSSGIAVVEIESGIAAAHTGERTLAIVLPSGELLTEKQIRATFGSPWSDDPDEYIGNWSATSNGVLFLRREAGVVKPIVLRDDGSWHEIELTSDQAREVGSGEIAAEQMTARNLDNGGWVFLKPRNEKNRTPHFIGLNADGRVVVSGPTQCSGGKPVSLGTYQPTSMTDGSFISVCRCDPNEGPTSLCRVQEDGTVTPLVSIEFREGMPVAGLEQIALLGMGYGVNAIGTHGVTATSRVGDAKLDGRKFHHEGYFAVTPQAVRPLLVPGMHVTIPGVGDRVVRAIEEATWSNNGQYMMCRVGLSEKPDGPTNTYIWVRVELPSAYEN